MKAEQIRERFLSFFSEKGHKVLPSFPLIPAQDPSLLLINAGMAPLKPYFLGEASPPASRLATCQKCIRVVDIERVGKTDRHLTFFEMLGNFSFGDYFKKEAIAFAFELLTRGFSLPEEKLYVTVYEEDEEAEKLWQEVVNFPKEKIVRRGKEDNFWMAGETGPCGPDSEIFFDRGKKFGCGRSTCQPGCDCDRFLETWNLVFIQFNRKEDGSLALLPKKNIDTGMGLERLALLLQDKETLFATDLFAPLVNYLKEIKEGAPLYFYRLISDHIRASVHLINDGILPSNEGRGYVLRRILRKAALLAKKEGLDSLLFRCVPLVIHIFASSYPELKEKEEVILSVVKEEEERFLQTLGQGEKTFYQSIKRIGERGEKVLPGSVVFKLYDTYGFPLELTRELAQEEGWSIDEQGFQEEMEKQKWRSKAHLKKAETWKIEEQKLPPVSFIGYERLEGVGEILALLKQGKEVKEIHAGEEVEIVLSPTPFYAEGGGQVGDQGRLWKEDGEILITDCQRRKEAFVHKGKVQKGTFFLGDKVHASVDKDRRQETARHHTATHLLHAVLRQLLGSQVRQAGSLVSPEYLRFDFTFHRGLKKEELDEVTKRMHSFILQDLPVEYFYTSYEEAQKKGALAFFGEKYGQEVRVLKIGDVSLELCGGTHLKKTSEIGFFTMTREEGIGAGIRRIEALCGSAAFVYSKKLMDLTKGLASSLRCQEEALSSKIASLLQENRALQKKVEELETQVLSAQAEKLFLRKKEIGKLESLLLYLHEEPKRGKKLAELLRQKGLDLIFLATEKDATVNFNLFLSHKALSLNFHARELIEEIAKEAGGAGGGKKEAAFGAGQKPKEPQAFLKKIEQKIMRKQEVKL